MLRELAESNRATVADMSASCSSGFQQKCLTQVPVTPTMDESGLAKINLHPADWRDPGDRAKYLDALSPEVYTGEPIAFTALARLPLRAQLRAMLSNSRRCCPRCGNGWKSASPDPCSAV